MSEIPKRTTIAELEQLMQREDVTLEIRPDGTVVTHPGAPEPRKPLTQHHYLGDEY